MTDRVVGKSECWEWVENYDKLKEIPLDKRLEALLMVDMVKDRIVLANQLGIPLSLLHIMLQHKNDILNHWKFSPNCNTHLSLFEIQTMTAAHQILLEWRCRLQMRSDVVLSSKAILRKARYLKRLFDLKSFELSDSWLQHFNTEYLHTYKPKYVNGMPDIPHILRCLQKELPGRVFEKFKFYWLVHGKKVLESESEDDDDDADEQSVANQQIVEIDTADNVAEAVESETTTVVVNNSTDSESDVEEVIEPVAVIEIEDDDDEPANASLNSPQKEESTTRNLVEIATPKVATLLEPPEKEASRNKHLEEIETANEATSPGPLQIKKQSEMLEKSLQSAVKVISDTVNLQEIETANVAKSLESQKNKLKTKKLRVLLKRLPKSSQKEKSTTETKRTKRKEQIKSERLKKKPKKRKSKYSEICDMLKFPALHTALADTENVDEQTSKSVVLDSTTRGLLLDWYNDKRIDNIFKKTYGLKTYKKKTIQNSTETDFGNGANTAIKLGTVAAVEQSAKPTCSKDVKRIQFMEVEEQMKYSLKPDNIIVQPNVNEDDKIYPKRRVMNVKRRHETNEITATMLEQNVKPGCSRKRKIEETTNKEKVVIAQMKCTLDLNTVQQADVVNDSKAMHLLGRHLNEGNENEVTTVADLVNSETTMKAELLKGVEMEVDMVDCYKELIAQEYISSKIEQEVDNNIPSNSAPMIQNSNISCSKNTKVKRNVKRMKLNKEVSEQMQHSLELNTVQKPDSITIQPNFNTYEYSEDVEFFINSLREEHEPKATTLGTANTDEVVAKSDFRVKGNNENQQDEEETVELLQVLLDDSDDDNEEKVAESTVAISLPQEEINTHTSTETPICIMDNQSAQKYLQQLKLFAVRKMNKKAWEIIEELDKMFRYEEKC